MDNYSEMSRFMHDLLDNMQLLCIWINLYIDRVHTVMKSHEKSWNLKMHFPGLEKSWILGKIAEVMEKSWNFISLVQKFRAV